MKKILLLTLFALCTSLVFSQRLELRPPQPKDTILFSVFSKSEVKRLQYNKIKKKKQYPYLEIYIHPNGVKDSLIFGYSKPLISVELYKKGYIPVYYNF